jgi:hypothetical protein
MHDTEFPDPFEEAAQTAVRDAIKMATILMGVARAERRIRERMKLAQEARDDRVRREFEAKEHSERAALRAQWAPANDQDWIRHADLADTAVAWCAAVPYADTDDTAISAVVNCEERLRQLHPHAMARYDRLRVDGAERISAMREAAPLFTRPPGVHEQPGVPRAALQAGNGLGYSWVDQQFGPSREEYEAYTAAMQILRRGSQILHGLQAGAARAGMPPLGDTDQRTVLLNTTNIPEGVISLLNGTRRPWQQDFPFPISEVLAIAQVDTRTQPPTRKKAAVSTQRGVPS